LLGILAVGRGKLTEPVFNIGREMNFHDLQGTRKPASRQHGAKAARLRWS
jgi:hypothetical protein